MKSTPLTIFVTLLISLSLLGIPYQAYAKPAKGKSAQAADAPVKDRLVLMPLRVGKENQNMRGPMETALVEGLSQKYRVYSGDEVELKTKEIYSQETQRANTAKKDCDETRCLQDIGIAFKAEYVAIGNVTKIEGGYLLALNIRSITDNKDVHSKSLPCEGCSAFQVIDKLKELSRTPSVTQTAAPAPAPVPEPAPAVSSKDPEGALWNEVQKGNTIDDYQAYLSQYPKGKYIALAKIRSKKLEDQAAAEQARQDQSAWDAATATASEAAYQDYQRRYPQGQYVGLVPSRIKKLQNDRAAREEAAQWQSVQNSGNDRTLQNFITQYPGSIYATAAQEKLSALQKNKAEEAKGPRPGQVFKDCNDCAEMVVIPAGSFTMGGTSGDEAPAHRVTISKPFALGKTEVTQAQWQAVMGSNPSNFTNCGGNCPVEQVSWDDIQTFIQRLNQKTGKHYRLPTEAEWEYACRGGQQTEYCGGDSIDSVAWYGSNSGSTTYPGAQKQANTFGLYDMSGNVWEWGQDSYHNSFNGAPNDGSEWSGDGGGRVLRGGSWNNFPDDARSTFRYYDAPDFRDDDIGFRVARTLP